MHHPKQASVTEIGEILTHLQGNLLVVIDWLRFTGNRQQGPCTIQFVRNIGTPQ